MTGINIQTPWSHLLINGSKTVETRSYSLPKKYENVELALIETPGKSAKFKSRIIGTITFSHSFLYETKDDWISNYDNHMVDQNDKLYGWSEKPKYGWVVSRINKFDQPKTILSRKGIIFTTGIEAGK
jgi:hypothetical protein